METTELDAPASGAPLSWVGLNTQCGRALFCAGALLLTWIYTINLANTELPPGVPWQQVYLFLLPTLALGAVFSSRLSLPRGPISGAGMAVGAFATLVATLGSVIIALPNFPWPLDRPAMAYMAMAFTGLGAGWMYLRWGALCAQVPLEQGMRSLLTGLACGIALKRLLELFPPEVSLLACAAFPAILFVVLVATLRNGRKEWDAPAAGAAAHPHVTPSVSELVASRGEAQDAARIVVCLALLGSVDAVCTLGFTGVPSGGILSALASLFSIGIVLLVLYIAFFRKGSFTLGTLWKVVCPLLALALASSMFGAPDVAQSIMVTTYSLIVQFTWLVITDASRRLRLHPHVAFALGWSVYALVGWAVVPLGEALLGSGVSLQQVLVVATGIALAAMLLLEIRPEAQTQRLFSEVVGPAPEPSDYPSIDARCHELGTACGLTPREIEVMQLICKGRSKTAIAETLALTENTVRGHAKNLYRKLGVHSKTELQKLVGL